MVFITFIIPTLGRNSLINSLNSLIQQTNKDWNVLVIFDGINKNIDLEDERIKYIEIKEKIGGINSIKSMSGEVRNIGLKIIDRSKTEWIAFLDDDDILNENYIDKLKEEINFHPEIEVCIFRMCYPNGYVLPAINDKIIKIGNVGISFAFKYTISPNIFFINSPFEDYYFIKELCNNNYKIIISSFVMYYINTNNNNNKIKFYPKVKINF